MSHKTSIIFWILITALIVLSLITIGIVIEIHKQKSKNSKIEYIKKMINKDRLKKADTTLSRIRIIADSNSKFEGLYKRLMHTFDTMSREINKVEADVAALVLNLKKISFKEFRKQNQKLELDIKIINDLDIRFNNNSLKVTQQDEFTRSEKTFYNENLREAISVYKDKRILLDRVSIKIDNLLTEVSGIEKKFNKALQKANTKETSLILKEYSGKVVEFCEIINKGPSLQTYIYETIPRMVNELLKHYKSKKTELGASLEHINFSQSISVISKRYHSIKINFENLKLSLVEKAVREVLKSLKVIEKMINSEIVSRNTFVTNFEGTITEIEKALIEYIKVKKLFREINAKGININVDIVERYKGLINDSKLIDNQAIEFKNILNNPKMPFTSKLSRMKMALQRTGAFIEEINFLNEYAYDLDIERTKLKNKFNRTKIAFDNILASIKSENIKLDSEKVKLIKESQDFNSKAAKIISGRSISSNDKEKIDKSIVKMISVYKLIAGSKKIAEITKNLISKFSIDRAINDNLNYQLSIAEKEYLEGEYASSLNAIIIYLEGE